MAEPEIIDGTGLILGRLASEVAKRVLEGKEVVVVNAEKCIISGSKAQILERYTMKQHLGGPHRSGPFYPRMPDQILRRTVRGMLPYKKPRGKAAYRRFKAYIGVPKEFEGRAFQTVESAKNRGIVKYMELGELAKNLGANFEVVR